MKLPPKRRKGEGPSPPPGGGKFRTQRGVTGSESRDPSPAPQGSNQVPGCHAPGGWQLLRRVGASCGKQGEEVSSRCPGLCPSPVLDWRKRGNEATSVDTSILPAAQQGRPASRGALKLVGEDTDSQRWIWSWKVSACDRSVVTGGGSPVLGLKVSQRASLVNSDKHQGCLSEVTPQVARHPKPPFLFSYPSTPGRRDPQPCQDLLGQSNRVARGEA